MFAEKRESTHARAVNAAAMGQATLLHQLVSFGLYLSLKKIFKKLDKKLLAARCLSGRLKYLSGGCSRQSASINHTKYALYHCRLDDKITSADTPSMSWCLSGRCNGHAKEKYASDGARTLSYCLNL